MGVYPNYFCETFRAQSPATTNDAFSGPFTGLFWIVVLPNFGCMPLVSIAVSPPFPSLLFPPFFGIF